KKLNPHIRRFCTPPNASKVTLYLPKGKRENYLTFRGTLTDDDKVRWYRYRIRRGDNLIGIARRFKLSVPAIKSINELRSSRIVAGKHLLIPIPVGRNYPPGTITASTAAGSAGKSAMRSDKKATRYRVKRGDTMWDLAETHGVSVEQICRWNDIRHARRLREGQVLTLFADDAGTSSSIASKSSKQSSSRGAADPEGGDRRMYTVRRGDNLYAISRRLGAPLDKLIAWNRKDPHNPLIHPGEMLIYYQNSEDRRSGRLSAKSDNEKEGCSGCIRYRIKKGDNLSSLARLFSVELAQILEANQIAMDHILHAGDIILIPNREMVGENKPRPKRVVYYHVEKGDNLWTISRLFNVPMSDLYRLNGLGKQSVLMPGDTIRIALAEEM
ncbi:MAG: LysM peptidoglycan-binding domain-containing protein, partial [Chitinivibrionales bacterium]|nr:LysM peptidoglycan-binding domain-containing protein [Chitinivibrionales bacterium]MBD3356115.1 LysM peptidoglycan-binding domain-containing protein [Chitinivibrionales bacterium]